MNKIKSSELLVSKCQITLIYTPVYTSGLSPSWQRSCFNKPSTWWMDLKFIFDNPNLINSTSSKQHCSIYHLIIWFFYLVLFHEPIKAKANIDALCENSISHHASLTESHKAAATFLTFNADRLDLDLLYITSHSSVIKISSLSFIMLGLYSHKFRLLHPVVLVFSSQHPIGRRSVTAV